MKTVKNKKTGTIGYLVEAYNRTSDHKLIYEVIAFASYGKNAHWIASNCEIVE